MKKSLISLGLLIGIFGCDTQDASTKTEPAVESRLQEVPNARYGSSLYAATIIVDTKTGREYILNYKGGIVEIK